MKYQQLHIDIKTKDGISLEMYRAVCKVIEEHGGEVMDDAQAPYTEDMFHYYKELDV